MLKHSCFAIACIGVTACSLDLMGTYDAAPARHDPTGVSDAAPPNGHDAGASDVATPPPAKPAPPSADAAAPSDAGAMPCPPTFPPELEPNDLKSEPIGDRICGIIGPGDVDRFSFHSDQDYEFDFVGDDSVEFSLSIPGPGQGSLLTESGDTTFFGDGKQDPINVKVWSSAPTKQLYYLLVTPH